MAASSASAAPRQLQVMAELLAPFAGDDAPKLAMELRKRFGSLSRALKASPGQIAALGEPLSDIFRLLLAARDVIETAQKECLSSGPVDPSDAAFVSYLRTKLCGRDHETLLAVFCDSTGQYLIDEEVAWGGVDEVRMEMSRLFRRALSLDAGAVVLAHNHPSGDCRPSRNDIEATRRVASLGEMLGCAILDHIIVTPHRAYSMKAGGHF